MKFFYCFFLFYFCCTLRLALMENQRRPAQLMTLCFLCTSFTLHNIQPMFMYVYLIAVSLQLCVCLSVSVLFGCVIKCYYEMALGPIFIMRYLVYALVRVREGEGLSVTVCVCVAASVWLSMLRLCGLFVCLRRFCGHNKCIYDM